MGTTVSHKTFNGFCFFTRWSPLRNFQTSNDPRKLMDLYCTTAFAINSRFLLGNYKLVAGSCHFGDHN